MKVYDAKLCALINAIRLREKPIEEKQNTAHIDMPPPRFTCPLEDLHAPSKNSLPPVGFTRSKVHHLVAVG